MSSLVETGTRLGRDHSRQHERFRMHWGIHVRRTREEVLRCAELVATPERLTVLGAGSGYNLPLAELCARFSTVRLVDIDRDGLGEAVANLPADTRGRASAEVADLTGGAAAALLEAGSHAVAGAANAAAATAALTSLVRAAREPTPTPEQLRAWRANCVISSCVASQLALFPYRAIAEEFERKFGAAARGTLFVAAGFAELRERWARAHGAALAEIVEPGGAVYGSDTVAETPCLAGLGREPLAAVVDAVASFLRQQRDSALRAFLTDAGKADLASRFAQAAPLTLAATAAGRRDQGDRLLKALSTDLDASSRRVVAWAFMTAVGTDGLLVPEREIELTERIVAAAERLYPAARQPILATPFANLFPAQLKPDGELRSWLWTNNPCAAATLEGGAYRVEAQIFAAPV